MEGALEDEFGFSVGASGDDALIFVDRHALGVVEEIGGGGEDEALHAVGDDRAEEVGAVGDVVSEVEEWILHGFADDGFRSEVHDGLGA